MPGRSHDAFAKAGYGAPMRGDVPPASVEVYTPGYQGQGVATPNGMSFFPKATYPDLGGDGLGLRAVAFGTAVFDLRTDLTDSTGVSQLALRTSREMLIGYQFHCFITLQLQFGEVSPANFRWYVMTRGHATNPQYARYLTARQDVTTQVLAGTNNVSFTNGQQTLPAAFGSTLTIPVQGPLRYWGLTLICDYNGAAGASIPAGVHFFSSMALH